MTRKIQSSVVFGLSLCMLICPACVFASENNGTEQEYFVYKRGERPDPFVPLLDKSGGVKDAGPSKQEVMAENLKKITVNGVFWDDVMPLVLVNNKMHKQGDVVEGLTIKKINSDSVVLEYYELVHEITLIDKKKYDNQGGMNEDIH